VLLLNGVVYGEVVAELLAEAKELLDGHASWPFLGFTGRVDYVPGIAEVVVEVVHVVCHAIELTEFSGREFWQWFFLGNC
jgi:hypothetical protein